LIELVFIKKGFLIVYIFFKDKSTQKPDEPRKGQQKLSKSGSNGQQLALAVTARHSNHYSCHGIRYSLTREKKNG
jgi:hypothetical protein